LGGPIRRPLAVLGADLAADLGVHEFGDHPGHRLADHVGVLAGKQLVGKLGSGHPWALGHRGAPGSSICEGTDDHRASGGRTHNQRLNQRRLLHHYLRLDLR
jgi:hypothetical protein